MKHLIPFLLAILLIVGVLMIYFLSPPQSVEWEHGVKTNRVIATCYNNPMGYNIGFHFPGNEYNADRREVADFFEAHGGIVWEMGGYPDAPDIVAFKDVTDAQSCRMKLKVILPYLDRLMRTL